MPRRGRTARGCRLRPKPHKSDRQTCYCRAGMRTDVHQHLWSEPVVEQLALRRELPFIRIERGLTVLYLAGERPYVIDRGSEDPARRAALVERDGLDRALLCLSSPIGIEGLCREQATALLDAYHEGALSVGARFGVWGAVALDRPEPGAADRAPAPLLFDETSSYGPVAVGAVGSVVGARQILYGSDRPVLEPRGDGFEATLDWDLVSEVTLRALGEPSGVAAL